MSESTLAPELEKLFHEPEWGGERRPQFVGVTEIDELREKLAAAVREKDDLLRAAEEHGIRWHAALAAEHAKRGEAESTGRRAADQATAESLRHCAAWDELALLCGGTAGRDLTGDVLLVTETINGLRAEVRAVREEALTMARGCHDYNGGYGSAEGEAYHGGVDTVITVLTRWAQHRAEGAPLDWQLAAVRHFGAATTPAGTHADADLGAKEGQEPGDSAGAAGHKEEA